jgi:hypothetical protein
VGQTPLAEPPQGRGAPGGSARRADILPQQERFEPKFGRCEIADGIFPGTAQVTHGVVLNLGDVDRGQVPRAHQAGELDRITTGGFDLLASLLGDQ